MGETRVLRRYVRIGVYGFILLLSPVIPVLLDEPLKYAVANNAVFLLIATAAIEGAFAQGMRIRMRIAFPAFILASMRGEDGQAGAAAQALETILATMKVDSAMVLLRGHERASEVYAVGLEADGAEELVQTFRPTIDAARPGKQIVRVGSKERQLVFIPLEGLQDDMGMLILRANKQSIVKDAVTLQNIGSRLGLHLETLWQKEQLTREKAHGQAVLSAIPDAMLRIKSDGTITYFVSQAGASQRLALPPNPVGERVYDYLPAALAQEVREHIRKVLASGLPAQFEFELTARSRTIYREARIVQVAADEVLTIVRDIGERRNAEEALRQREEYFRQLIDNAQDAIVVVTNEGLTKYASPAVTRLLGYDAEELLGSDALMLVHPDDREDLMKLFSTGQIDSPTAAREQSVEFRAQRKDGSWCVIEATARQITPGVADSEIVVNGRDVTERKRAADVMRESEERMRTIFQEAPIGMAIVGADFTVLTVNTALCEMLGYTEDEVIALGVAGVSHPEDLHNDVEHMAQLTSGEVSSYRLEKRYLTKSGETMWGDLTATVIRDPDGAILYGLGMIENITDRKRAEDKVRHLAFHDALTGLPNRALFRDRLELAIAQARRSEQMAAVMFLDLDRFKMVNDSVGHAEGDRLLCQVAEKISLILREGDTVARFGGDEFTVLLPTIEKVQDAVRIADRILQGLSEPFVLVGKEFLVSGSIGITIIPDDGEDADTLLRNADIAMYRAKEQGRNQYQLYAPHMNEVIVERIAFEASLRHAIENEEFVLHYQPQFDVHTMQLTGVEALVRWQRPDGALMPPASFIPVAEETALIVPLGEWVLRRACSQAKEWQAAGLPPVRVAVNISAREFQNPDIAKQIGHVLQDVGLDPRFLQIEITEGVAMEHAETTISTLKQLSAMGIQLALDDFGIGYSSMSYLKRFPIDVVKIDCSFVRNVGVDPADTALVRAIITMAHSLGIRVIAEGVESREQLAFLRRPLVPSAIPDAVGCDEFQGFLISRAVTADEIEPMLESGRAMTEIPSAA
ncbi:MAG: EAL domain-containing protein [Dehalococcoidia bacterium]